MSISAAEQVEDFQTLALAFQDVLGVVLSEDQQPLVVSRLHRVMQAFEMDSVLELAEKMRRPDQQRLNSEVLDAISRAGSRWFAYPAVSQLLNDYILDNIGETARFWVAGCGDGSLAYSLAIDISEYNLQHDARDVSILATDIFTDNLQQIRQGLYHAADLPSNLGQRGKYFEKRDDLNDAYGDRSGEIVQLRESVREMVSFEVCDLLHCGESLSLLDVVICPDILVYFSNSRRKEILGQFARALKPGGVLVVAEDQPVISSDFERVEHPAGIFYRQKAS